MKRIILIFILIASSSLFARNYDVLSYHLYVDWSKILTSTKDEPEKRNWRAFIEIKVISKVDSLQEFSFDCRGLQIDSVLLIENWNGDIYYISVEPQIPNDSLVITLPFSVAKNDSVRFVIRYNYVNPKNIGFYHRNTPYDTIYTPQTEHPVAGTLTEPNGSRYWFPCNDVPNDKALFSCEVIVPAGYMAVSNGLLDSIGGSYGGVYAWSSKYPMPPYLFTIVASDYSQTIENYAINGVPIPVHYYYWEEDWEGEDYNAKRMLSTTERTLQVFDSLFGKYPFEKYGVVSEDFTYLGYKSLGMEHQTLTSVSRSWFRSNLAVPNFTSFAHELGHHWIGNYVTCDTWQDIWFNEGGATWMEALYLEHIRDTVSIWEYKNHLFNNRRNYLKLISDHPETYSRVIHKLSDDAIFDYTPLVYSKAAWIFHHLREYLGDDLMFPFMRELLEKYAYGNISTQQFIDFFDAKVKEWDSDTHLDMQQFIGQWVYEAGHPKYAITSSIQQNTATLQLEQVQNAENVPEVFQMYLQIDFLKDNEVVHSERVENYERIQSYHFELNKSFDSLALNLYTGLLEVVSHNSVAENNDNINIGIYPNPANNTFVVENENANIESVQLFKMTGEDITSHFSISYSGRLCEIRPTSKMNAVVFVRINGQQTVKIEIRN